MKLPIYLDNHATTPVDPRVLDAMMPYFTTAFGNAGSRSHVFGWEAEAAVDEARHQVAAAMNAPDKEIVFTSGATESDNLAIFGVARAYRAKGNHVVTGRTEHHAVMDVCQELEKEGFRVTWLDPDRSGPDLRGAGRGGDHGAHGPRDADARQQRDRDDPPGRARSARSAATAASSSTPTPSRDSERCPSTSRR